MPPRVSLRIVAPAALALLALAPACNWPPGPTSGTKSNGSPGTTPTTPTTSPPRIISLDMTQSATAVNGTYSIFGSITYNDADDVVAKAEVYVYVTGKTLTIDVPPDQQTSSAAGLPFQFPLSADPPLGGAGPTNYTVTLVNKSGAASQPYADTVDLL